MTAVPANNTGTTPVPPAAAMEPKPAPIPPPPPSPAPVGYAERHPYAAARSRVGRDARSCTAHAAPHCAVVDMHKTQIVMVNQRTTFAELSKQKYGSDIYAAALEQYNRDHSEITEQAGTLKPGEMAVGIPPTAYLEAHYRSLIPGLPVEAPPPAPRRQRKFVPSAAVLLRRRRNRCCRSMKSRPPANT